MSPERSVSYVSGLHSPGARGSKFSCRAGVSFHVPLTWWAPIGTVDTMNLSPDDYKKSLNGEVSTSAAIRTVPHLRTAHPEYTQLNYPQCISIGHANPQHRKPSSTCTRSGTGSSRLKTTQV